MGLREERQAVKDVMYWRFQRRMSRRQVLGAAARAGIGLAGISLLGCAAPAAAPAATPKAGGALVVAQRVTSTMDPCLQTGGQDAYQGPNLYNWLTYIDIKGKSIPELAASWETPDPTTLIFKLRKGVKFHDGVDFNANAVKTDFDRVMDPKTNCQNRPRLAELKSYDVVDDSALKLTTKRPSASFLYMATGPRTATAGGGIVSPEAIKKYNNDVRQHGVGTGPFEFVEWRMDDHVTLKKFPQYWEQGMPLLDQITWRVIPDSTVAITMLKNGEVHLDVWFDFKDLETIKSDPNLVAVAEPVPGAVTVSFNQKKPPFNKPALRQALAYAIDREAISKVVYKGTHPPAQAWFGPSYWAFDSTIKGYPYDLAKAKEKLKEGGAPDGFEMTLFGPIGWPDWIQAAEMVQSMVAKVGIKVKVQQQDWPTGSTLFKDGKMEAGLIGWSGDPEPQPDITRAHSKTGLQWPVALLDGNDPVTQRVDALMDKADSIFSLEERMAVYKELQKLMAEQVHWELPLVYQTSRIAHRKEVKGYVQYPGRFFTPFRRTWLQK